MNISRRTALTIAAGTLTLAGCRATDDGGGGAVSSPQQPSAGPDTFPVTIKHKYGTTTITERPRRVVVVGLVEQDMLLALGVVPVAVAEWLKGADGEIYPWAMPKLGRRPAPKVIPQTDGINVEQVTAMKPDLILGVYAGITSAEYARLAKIAPTVAQPKEYFDYGVPWDRNALIVAKAVGMEAEGKKIVGTVKKQIAASKSKHPEFAGKRAVVAAAEDGLYLYGPQDPRTRILTNLGFTFPSNFGDISSGKSFGGPISAERTRELDQDVVVWVSEANKIAKASGGLWAQTKANKQGREVPIPYVTTPGETATIYSSAYSMMTPLSIPYLLDNLVPQLAAAVDGKPETKVPGPKPFSGK